MRGTLSAETSGRRATAPKVRPPVPVDEGPLRAWGKYAIGMGMVGLIAAVLSQDAYWTTLMIGALLFAGLASAWNLIGGFGGQFSFGHAAFFGLGAYSVALTQVRLGWSPWPGIVVGALTAGLLAAALALPIFRLRGPFFAIATLAVSSVVLSLANYLDFTGGSRGLTIPFDQAFIVEPVVYVAMMFAYCAAVVAISLAVVRSRLGYRLRAVRDDEEAARALGINPLLVKTTTLVLSAALTGVGGGLYAIYLGYIDPHTAFSISEVGVRLPLLALLGGVGTVSGPVIGALIIQPGADFLRGEFGAVAPGLHLVFLGALLIVFALFFKRGVHGAIESLQRRLANRWRSK